ncbi:hypothetical protein CI238_01751 [Colletotrichum incanum]|uniref:Clr5 domain-containing protein n=1 Tax=Colletotrichum incanum TaxID=1573173 RepID=A0A161W413_COLIC|nr:hypothetical protein CI238_01751 [Colletotrichum incanum]OHW98595.1 clr5 domain-containing protein [Colletotrichum incanum]
MTKAWREKRADITRLYIHENKTLNEVKAIMEEQHDFKASTRSYRQQFDKWGLAKYNCKKRTARRRSQDSGSHQYHHLSTGQDYLSAEASGDPGGRGMASDFPIPDPDAYIQPMSPQSCGSSLGSESAVEGGVVEDMMDVTGASAAAASHAPGVSYARDWPPQLSYMEQGRQPQQQQSVPYPQYTQQQHQGQQGQQHMQQRRRRRPSWDQQRTMPSPYGTLPSPPADLHDSASYYSMFSNDEAGMPSQPVRPQTYSVLHPDPRRQESYPHRQPQPQYHYHQRQQQPQMYSSAPIMPARRESVPYYGGVECIVRQPGQQ